jgi:hypothetical protein
MGEHGSAEWSAGTRSWRRMRRRTPAFLGGVGVPLTTPNDSLISDPSFALVIVVGGCSAWRGRNR